MSVRTLPLIEGVESVALPAVAEGELKAGEPDIVMTSLPLTGMAAAGVMAMVTVKLVAPARTSGRVNEGPVKPPFKISGKDPDVDRLRKTFDESTTAAVMAVAAA